MVYQKVHGELYVVSAPSWICGLWQVLTLFEAMTLVPSSIKSFSSRYDAKGQVAGKEFICGHCV